MKQNFLKKVLTASLSLALCISFLTPKAYAITTANEAKSTSTVPSKALVGYWHNFDNGTGKIKLSDVSLDWDVINLSFGEPTTVTSGDIQFTPFNATPAEFKEDVKYLQSKGKKVLISIGGQNGQVQLKTKEARDTFVKSVSNVIDTYGLDGLDIDFEGHSLYFDPGDKDFKKPTTPVIVNLISALKELKSKYGDKFILTMAPETFFVQMAGTFYGGLNSYVDPRCGAYLPVIYALGNDLNWLQVQYYNSGSINDINGKSQSMGNPEFYASLVDMLLTGFPIMGDKNNMFPALRPDQVVLGVPSGAGAGNGIVSNDGVKQAMNAIINGGTVGGYTIKEGYPEFRGLMAWSVNWDKFHNYDWTKYFRSYLDSLAPQNDELRAAKLSASKVTAEGSYSLTTTISARNLATSYELFENGTLIDSGNLQPKLAIAQVITKNFTNKSYGDYKYTVVVKDSNGKSLTSPECLVKFADSNVNPNKEDVNKDGKFDSLDLDAVATKYNVTSGDSSYLVTYDINSDGIIDIFDLTKVSAKIGAIIVPEIKEWKSGTAYVLGDKVTYMGKTYVCTYVHTSNDAWVPVNVPTLWQEVK